MLLEKEGVIHPSSLWKKARFVEDAIIGSLDTVSNLFSASNKSWIRLTKLFFLGDAHGGHFLLTL